MVKLIQLDSKNPRMEVISNVARAIKRGEVIIYPTDTVYGVGVNALDSQAVSKIFKIKERPLDKALPIAVSGLEMVEDLANLTDKAEKLIEAFWPGALTIILRKSNKIPEIVTGGKSGVGLRAPNHIIPLSIIKMSNLPIIATSANIHGNANPTSAYMASDQLGRRVDLIIDGGKVNNTPSTIINMLKEPPTIIRKGTITEEVIREVIGHVKTI